ncbi:peptidyl-prolyl cis-trans isomerase PASTICCINO1 [Populus alba x Populus x berolinensis]|uniref:peptidylprolyl isomerase n=2 Tax=Populus alba x Populus x berolinensis TaxID=444605 RepID=A0AAD6LKQ4_9ROSI|nr:peptidyl-prolyl cis-trans isomerase PASTICCINO1 [Populus alba x Populus x berolinensis]
MAAEDGTAQEYVPQKKNKEPTETEKRRKKIVPGSLMKAEIRPGGGDARPSDGDQVIYHCTVRTLAGVVVESTRSEYGGKGTPIRQVLGKSKMLLGLLEGLPTMLRGEVAMFKMKPQMHYSEEDCPVSPPSSFPRDDELHFEIEMIDFSKVKVVSDDLGVIKKVIDEGQGWESPREPYEVKAWISAKTGDDKVILSPKQGEPYFFTIGKSEVPKGLEMGIGTMTREEKAVIYVTNQYLTESPLMSVVGLEEVQFEVELIHFTQVRDMLGDGRLIKRRLRDGKGEFPMDCPLQDSLLRIHYKGMLLNEEKTVFIDTRIDNDGQPLEFSSGEGLVPEGFEMCARLMLPGEVALVTCPPDYAYDKFTRPANVPEGAHIEWEIELLGFEMPKDWTGLDFQGVMDEAEKIRTTGNRLFKEGKFELAKAKYEKVLREFNHVNPQDDEEGKVFLNTRNLLNLNVAACHLKSGECRKSIETCNKVLEANPAHVKALYRRGMAYMEVGDFEEARSDFEMMLKVDKSSEPDATAALKKLKQKQQDVEKKARRQFKGLFDKKPGEIADAGTDDRGEEQSTSENQKNDDQEDSNGTDTEDVEDVANEPREGLFSRLWPTGRRLFSALGLRRCAIL